MSKENGISKAQVVLILLSTIIGSVVGSLGSGLLTVNSDHFTTIANASAIADIKYRLEEDFVRADVYELNQKHVEESLARIESRLGTLPKK